MRQVELPSPRRVRAVGDGSDILFLYYFGLSRLQCCTTMKKKKNNCRCLGSLYRTHGVTGYTFGISRNILKRIDCVGRSNWRWTTSSFSVAIRKLSPYGLPWKLLYFIVIKDVRLRDYTLHSWGSLLVSHDPPHPRKVWQTGKSKNIILIKRWGSLFTNKYSDRSTKF